MHQDDSSSSTKVAALRFRNGGNDTCLKVPTSNQGLIIDTEGKANAFVLGVNGQIISPITASCNFSSSAQVLTNTLNIQGAVNAGSDTDKFLVLDADGNVDFRTGDEVKTDIGAVGSSGVSDEGGAVCQVAVWSSGTAISGSNCLLFDTANNRLGIGTTDPKAELHVVGEISGSNNVRLEGDCLILGGGQTIIRNYSTYLGLFAAGGSAKDVKAKSLALTNDFSNSAPTNGLYVQGTACFGSNVVINGTVTAQEFNTELVSASVVFESGSTQFGNSLDDTHTFTGSILLSGSQTIDIGGRNLYFCSTGAGGWPQIDADSNLFLGGGNAGNIQFMDHAIPSGDSSIDLGNANRYYRGLYADEAFLGNAISHVQTITGSVLVTGSTCLTGDLFLGDNRKVVLGDSTDFLLHHNGTDSVIDNNTGDLYITNKANDKDIIFRSDDGSGGFTEYLRLDGSDTMLKAHKKLRFLDNVELTIGNSDDLKIYHDGTDNIIQSDAEKLRFYSGSNEFFRIQGGAHEATLFTKNIRVQDNFRVDVGSSTDGRFFHDGTDMLLYHNGTDSVIDNNTGDLYITASRHMDGVRAKFGSGEDLSIYHDGSNSYINETGVGSLLVQASDLFLRAGGTNNTNNAIVATNGGVVSLYHNNTEKLATTADGIKVIGSISASGDITGSTLNLQGVVNAGTDTDKFLVLDSDGNVDFRTGANVLSDIGAADKVGDAGGAACQVGVWSSGTDLSGSNELFFNTANNRLGIGTNTPTHTFEMVGPAAVAGTSMSIANTYGESPKVLQFTYKSSATSTNDIPVAKLIGYGRNNNSIPPYFSIEVNDTVDGGSNLVTTTERFRIKSDGKVGIGTTTPLYKLHVVGSIYSNQGSVFIDSGCRLKWGNSNQFIEGTNNSSLELGAGGSTKLFVTGSGQVGIGTTTPPHALSVQGTISRLNSSGVQIVNLLASSDHGQIKVLNSSGTERILLNSNGLSYFNGGDVAIGRTTQLDSAKLSIQADSGEDVIGIQANDNSSTTKLLNVFNSSGTDIVSITANNDSTPDLMFNVDDGLGNITQVLKLDSSQNAFFSGDTTLTSGSVNIETFQEGVQFYNGSNYTSNRIKLTSAQNLQFLAGGSFQFTPNSTMQLLAGKRFLFKNADNSTCIGLHNGGSGDARLDFEDGSGNVKMAISSSGNIGIGNTAPTEKLEVTGFVKVSGSAADSLGIILERTGLDTYSLRHLDGGLTIFNETDSKKEMFFLDEKVGLGTTNIQARLHLSGSTSTASAFRQSRAGVRIWDQAIDSSGRLQWGYRSTESGTRTVTYALDDNNNVGIGIGANSPQTTLHVAGTDSDGSAATLRIGGPSNGTGNNTSRLELVENTTNSNADMHFGYSFTADGDSTNNLLIKNHNNSTSGNTALSIERATGRVGIGHSDSYGEVLDISGSIVIRDIGSTRGIRRNNEAYDLRLMGGTSVSNGAHISLGGDLRGGSGNSIAGAAVITQGGTDYANRASVSSSISFQVCSNAGSATDMFIQGCSGNVGIGSRRSK